MKLSIIKLFVFLLIFILLGLFREYVFININNLIYFKYYKNTTIPIPFGFGWLTRLSYAELYYLKYPLTLAFALIYFGLSYYLLKQMGAYSLYIKILITVYIVIFAVSSVLMLYAYWVHQKLNDTEYSFSRGLMGLAQSPLIAFVLFVVYLWDKNKLRKS